jgi:hypothetical protein
MGSTFTGYICFLGHLVEFWTTGLHDGQVDVVDRLPLAILPEVVFECIIVREDYDNDPQLGRLELGHFRIQLLDQLRQGLCYLSGENQDHRILAVHLHEIRPRAHQARLLGVGDERLERTGQVIPRLGA